MKIGFPTSFAKFFIIGMGLGFGFATATVIAVSVSTTFSKGGLLTAEAMNILKSAVESIPDWTKGEKAGDAVYTAGNVGIGKTTPAGKLDVSGDICISGDCVSSWRSVALQQYKKNGNSTTAYIYYENGFDVNVTSFSDAAQKKSHELSIEAPIEANFVEIYISYYAKSRTHCLIFSVGGEKLKCSKSEGMKGSSIKVEVRRKGESDWDTVLEETKVAVSDPIKKDTFSDSSDTASTLILFHELTPNQKTDGIDLKITGHAEGKTASNVSVMSSINNIQTVVKLSN